MGKKQKQKQIKQIKQIKQKERNVMLLKYSILGLSLVVAVLVLVFVKLQLSSDFVGSKEVELTFSNDANLDQVVEKTKSVGEYEKIEKINSAQVVVSFTELGKNEEELTEKYSEIEGFSNLDLTNINLVNKNYNRTLILVYLGMPVFLLLQYLFLNSIEKSRDKVSLLFAFVTQNVFAFVLLLSLLTGLSGLYPLTQETLILFVTILIGRLLVDMILLFKVNLAAKVNSQKDFPQFVNEFVLKYDRNFVIVALFSTIVFLPMILIANEPVIAFILLGSFIALNILLETFVFTDLINFFNFLIRRIPVVRNLKWSRK